MAKYPKAVWIGQTKNTSGKFAFGQPSMLVMHYTAAGSGKGSANYLYGPHSPSSSAHFVVDRDGTVYQISDTSVKTWHAGVSSWKGKTGINSYGIGIEIANWGYWRTEISKYVPDPEKAGWIKARHKNGGPILFWEPYPEAQMKAVEELMEWVLKQHSKIIPSTNVVGHDDIAPGRKADPGPAFPWPRFRDVYDRVRNPGRPLIRTPLMGSVSTDPVSTTKKDQAVDLPDVPSDRDMSKSFPSASDVANVELIPFYKSKAILGVGLSIGMKLAFVAFKWTPANWGISDTAWTELTGQLFLLISFIGDYLAAKGRKDAVKGGIAKQVYFGSVPSDYAPIPLPLEDPGVKQTRAGTDMINHVD